MRKNSLQIDTLEDAICYTNAIAFVRGVEFGLSHLGSLTEREELVCELLRHKSIGDTLKAMPTELGTTLSVFSSLDADEVAPGLELPDDEQGLPGRASTQAAVDKLDVESEAFEALKPRLFREFRGLFVAIHNGEVIDSDKDDFCLAERIEERARREGPIAICMVAREEDQARHTYPDAGFESPFG